MRVARPRLRGSAGRSVFELFPRGNGAHRWICTITGTVLDRVPLLVGICERKWSGAPCRTRTDDYSFTRGVLWLLRQRGMKTEVNLVRVALTMSALAVTGLKDPASRC